MKNALGLILLVALTAMPLQAETRIVKLGGAAVLPDKMAAELVAGQDNLKLQIIPECAQSDISDLIKGRVDLMLMSRYLTAEEIKAAKEAGMTLHPFTFAYEGIAVVVAQDSLLQKLSRQQVKDIIGGKISVWEELGISGGEFRVCLQEDGNMMKPQNDSMIEPALRKGETITRLPQNMFFHAGDGMVTVVGENKNILGFAGVSRVTDSKGVKTIPVDGLLPTLPAVQGRSYPYIQGIYIYTRGLPSGEIKQTVNYLTGSPARKILNKYGMVSGNN